MNILETLVHSWWSDSADDIAGLRSLPGASLSLLDSALPYDQILAAGILYLPKLFRDNGCQPVHAIVVSVLAEASGFERITQFLTSVDQVMFFCW
jgi:hypothetical protein